MGRIIVKRDNGKFNLWTTVCDDYIFTEDMSLDEFEKEYIELKKEEAEEDAKRSIQKIRENSPRSFTNEKDL